MKIKIVILIIIIPVAAASAVTASTNYGQSQHACPMFMRRSHCSPSLYLRVAPTSQASVKANEKEKMGPPSKERRKKGYAGKIHRAVTTTTAFSSIDIASSPIPAKGGRSV